MNAYQRRRHLAKQSGQLPEDVQKALERLRIFRNGAIGLIALPVLGGFMILSLTGVAMGTREAVAMTVSILIGVALGKYVHDRSMRLAAEVVPQLEAMDGTDPEAISWYARRSWKDAFAPWMPYRPPAVLRWIIRLLSHGRGRRFGFVRSILPDGLIPPTRSPKDAEKP